VSSHEPRGDGGEPSGYGEDTDARDRAEISRLADEVLPALAARLGASGLGELEVRGAGWRVRLRRQPSPAEGSTETTPARAASHPPGASRHGGEHAHEDEGLAHSPAVGYFGPRADLAVGLPVRAGDGLGHVEVLGLRQEVLARVDGIVGHVFVEPGQAVEYGQELIRVDSLGRHDASGSDEDGSAGGDGR
jgi:biotin carboxyl carrier protein